MARIFSLLEKLPREPGTMEPPRLWVDTLCCPLEPDAKVISLERIANVYKSAHHVLVLDKSLMGVTYEGTHVAELLVRAFGCSPWMRRLWTLQGKATTCSHGMVLLIEIDVLAAIEGALARTLQIQYADRAANSLTMLTDLLHTSAKDLRYRRIAHDVSNAVRSPMYKQAVLVD